MIRIDKITSAASGLLNRAPQKAISAPVQTIADGEKKLLSALDALASQKAANVIKPADNSSLLKKLKTTMQAYLSSHKYQMGPEGRFFKDFDALDADDLAKIGKKHSLSDFTKFHMCGDISTDDVIEIANMNNGKYLSYWNENPDELIFLTSRIKSPSSFQDGLLETDFLGKAKKFPAIWDIAMDSFINTPKREDVQAIMMYKSGGFSHINRGLVDGSVPGDYAEAADSISKTISKHTIKSPLKVFRGEGPEILTAVTTNSGEINLAKILSKALEEGKTDTVISDILKSNPQVMQKGFMSTSFSDSFLYKPINWELTVKPGTNGIFLETLPLGSDGKELEVLLQKGSKINITDIEFKQGKIPQWFLKGEVSN